MAEVILRENENLESAMKRFKKKLDAEGILKKYKDNQYFKKPSVIKREKIKDALRKRKIEELKIERAKLKHKKKRKDKPNRSYKTNDQRTENEAR